MEVKVVCETPQMLLELLLGLIRKGACEHKREREPAIVLSTTLEEVVPISQEPACCYC